jgi:GntR family transcriptional regulator / MocR family aminotransferase
LRYRARRNTVVDALRRHLPEYRVRGAEAGMQLLLELPPRTDETVILRAAARRGIELWNGYEMRLQPEPSDPGLLIGYGNIKDTLIDAAVEALAEVVREAGGAMTSADR